MTDNAPEMSAEEKASLALVSRLEFHDEAVWLPLLAVHCWNAGQTTIDGRTFTDCLIEGPAVMAVMDGCEFEGCNMGVAADPRTLLLKPLGEKIAGAIGLSNCRFVRCRFAQVGFTGADSLLAEMERDLLGARGQDAAS